MTTKKRTIAQNGVVPTAVEVPQTPNFTPEELNLLHQLLAQASFPAQAWEMARAADSARQKIEAWVGSSE